MNKLLLFISIGLLFASCRSDKPELLVDQELDRTLEASSPTGTKSYYILPASTDFSSIPQDPNNPITVAKVELGKLLFHETGILQNPKMPQSLGTASCASCHHAAAGFQANVLQGIGEGGWGFGLKGENRIVEAGYHTDSLDVQPIRSPSAMNVAYQEIMLWNGQFGATGVNAGTNGGWVYGTPTEVNFLGYEGVESQAIEGLKVHRMVVDSLLLDSLGYIPYFDAAFPNVPFGDRYDRERAGLAIAAYERTLLANQSPFQLWLKGDSYAMSDDEKEGAIIFFGKGKCYECHQGPALSSNTFHALGMKDLFDDPNCEVQSNHNLLSTKKGRGAFTGNSAEDYQFKVPQLYNLEDSKFFGHGGSFTSIRQVLEYKNNGSPENPSVPVASLSSFFHALNLSSDELDKLEKFLKVSLYDPNLDRYTPMSLPSGNCFPNADAQSKLDMGCN
jgi:cytochrome c peroxidase